MAERVIERGNLGAIAPRDAGASKARRGEETRTTTRETKSEPPGKGFRRVQDFTNMLKALQKRRGRNRPSVG